MTESAHVAGLPANAAQRPANHHAHVHPPASFQHALRQASVSHGVHRAVVRAPAVAAPKTCTAASLDALNKAMTREGVPASWQPDLAFIMAQESGGKVDAKSPIHTARGLYQLTAANYHHNPRGAASFGDAVEEAQGGIRYIQQRYGTADNAVAFWRSHHWY